MLPGFTAFLAAFWRTSFEKMQPGVSYFLLCCQCACWKAKLQLSR
uniref:Uncharacterized protein n=1 Tax=Anguilla anguilla TaxID=7936 RepID=A0A0E9UKK5_ANGAN